MAKNKTLSIVQSLDLERYMGEWHEIARLPNWFERKCVRNISAKYKLLSNGQVLVVNSCQKNNGRLDEAVGIGRVKNGETGHLLVTFAPKLMRALPFLWADYCVIHIDENYENAVVGEPSRKYLWILSRKNSIAKDSLSRLIEIAQKEGFDTERLIYPASDVKQ
jgi:apolipoprotein D and lipocalin family protein